jgi:hypothetical protein
MPSYRDLQQHCRYRSVWNYRLPLESLEVHRSLRVHWLVELQEQSMGQDLDWPESAQSPLLVAEWRAQSAVVLV